MTTLVALACLLSASQDAPPARPTPAAESFKPDPAWKPLGRSLWFDPKARRLVIRARIALNDGPLEHLLCRKGTKEHESIFATDAEARAIHAGLLLTGAEPGHPVRFRPEFASPTGTAIAIEAEWTTDGKTQRADVRSLIRDDRRKRPLAVDWVFAGSEIIKDARDGSLFYAAEEGDYFTVANFPNAILDLPFASDSSDAERLFSADPSRIPPRDTPVTLYLAPRKPAGPTPGAPATPPADAPPNSPRPQC